MNEKCNSVNVFTTFLIIAGDKWEWEDDDLVFAGIGNPKTLLENLENGFFKPHVSQQAKKRRASKINTLLQYEREVEGVEEDDDDEEESFVTHEDIVVGEIPVEGYAVFKELRIKSKLQSLCTDLCDAFDERVKPSGVIKTAVEVFHTDGFEWFERLVKEPETEEERRKDDERKNNNLDGGLVVMQKLLDSWDQPVAKSFSVENLSRGLCGLLGVLNWLPDGSSLEEVYKSFIEKFGTLDQVREFKDMFETIQIKTFSEAVCETIGSVMKVAKGEDVTVNL